LLSGHLKIHNSQRRLFTPNILSPAANSPRETPTGSPLEIPMEIFLFIILEAMRQIQSQSPTVKIMKINILILFGNSNGSIEKPKEKLS
jgi:hypothetical protein